MSPIEANIEDFVNTFSLVDEFSMRFIQTNYLSANYECFKPEIPYLIIYYRYNKGKLGKVSVPWKSIPSITQNIKQAKLEDGKNEQLILKALNQLYANGQEAGHNEKNNEKTAIKKD